VEVAAYRVAQEAITNVVRHASATSCRVAATVSDHNLVLEVQDDGRGGASTNGGIGLRSMRDRADEIGGTVEIASAERGTTVTLSLPREPIS
jgi:signal transduction histidine kinase